MRYTVLVFWVRRKNALVHTIRCVQSQQSTDTHLASSISWRNDHYSRQPWGATPGGSVFNADPVNQHTFATRVQVSAPPGILFESESGPNWPAQWLRAPLCKQTICALRYRRHEDNKVRTCISLGHLHIVTANKLSHVVPHFPALLILPAVLLVWTSASPFLKSLVLTSLSTTHRLPVPCQQMEQYDSLVNQIWRWW